ncbi:MAG: hypothetical protein GX575_04930 [Candidatus Anammoximicrobium sp.]|nr:hypothetical protein [Candidatus Anammoximicrobium sp.]
MKDQKMLWAVLALLSGAGFLTPLPARGGEDAEELLKNPGFDEERDGQGLPRDWSTSRDRVLWREGVYLSKNYELVSQQDAYVLATQAVRLKPGQRYTIRLTLKGDGGALGGALIVHGEQKPTREMALLWNLQPSADYETYVGTFVAPNPVAQLLIYNVARKGTIAYDRVSLRAGEPDEPIISQLSLREIDRPLGPVPETRHIDWASPLAGGPVRTCFTLRTFLLLRDAADLAQRIDLDYDVLHTGYDGDECVSDTARRATKRLGEGGYEVYVVASRMSDVLTKTIRQRVEAGAGLVVLEGFGQGSKLLPAAEWKTVDDAHYLRSGIPWDLMPEKILSSVQTGEIGKGRAVRLVVPTATGRVWGLLPSENSADAYKSRQFEYWEWWESLLARTIVWAARREGPTAFAVGSDNGDGWTVQAAHAPPGARMRVGWRSGREIRFDGPLLRKPPQEFPLAADDRIALSIPPDLPAGPVIADLTLLDGQGQALNWCSVVRPVAQQARLVALQTDREAYAPGEEVKLAVKLSAARSAETTVEARLIDAFGRVVAATARTARLAAGETDQELTLPIRSPVCVHHRAVVRLLCDGREQDSVWRDVLVPSVGPGQAAADFTATTWAPGMTHPPLLAEFSKRTQQLGLNSEFGTNLYAMSEHGLPCAAYIGVRSNAFRCEKHTGNGVRPDCLSDPQVVAHFTEAAREAAQRQQPHGIFAVGITDEAFLASRHKRDEVCFCDHCQRRFCKWLQARYETLTALNAQWGSSYASWDEVRGGRTEDVRGKANFAPFVDFRTFMTDVWIDGCKAITDAYHEVAPQTPVGHTNTFGADPFNGNDYWKLCTQVGFGWGQEYAEAIKSSGQKAIFDIWRSFVETPESRAARGAKSPAGPDDLFFNYGWIGYDHRVAAAQYEPWWLALHGSRGVSYYATNSMDVTRGTSWSLVYPSLQCTAYSNAVAEALRDLRAGCGKLFLEYQREQPKIALLWSYPSMLVSWCESTSDEPEPSEQPGSDSFVTHYVSALHFRQHVNELQLDYVYLAPDQILGSDILRQYPVLFLPFTVAGSQPLVEKLQAYVQEGGILIGDLRCLRTDEHGTPFAGPQPLEQLFGVARGEGRMHYGRTQVTFTTAGEGLDLRGRQVELYGRETVAGKGALALAAHATGEPAVLVRRQGQGLSIYLNFCFPPYDVVTRELVAQIAKRAGVAPSVRVEPLAGDQPPRCYERNTFTRGPLAVHALIRDHRRCTDTDPVRVCFSQTGHVYDVRARKYHGQTDTLTATLAPGDTALYASLPYRVTGLEVQVPERATAGASVELGCAVRADGQQLGDHVFHVELCDAAGRTVPHYAQNVLAPAGRSTLQIPLALNEVPGAWTIRLGDMLTGSTAERPLQVDAP